MLLSAYSWLTNKINFLCACFLIYVMCLIFTNRTTCLLLQFYLVFIFIACVQRSMYVRVIIRYVNQVQKEAGFHFTFDYITLRCSWRYTSRRKLIIHGIFGQNLFLFPVLKFITLKGIRMLETLSMSPTVPQT